MLQALSDVAGGYGKGHLNKSTGGVYPGAKEHERLRNEVASRSATVEQAASTVGGAELLWQAYVKNATMGHEIANVVTRPLQLCTHDFSRYCVDECSCESQCGTCHAGPNQLAAGSG